MFGCQCQLEGVSLQVEDVSFFSSVEVDVVDLALVCGHEYMVEGIPDNVQVAGQGVLGQEIDLGDALTLFDI